MATKVHDVVKLHMNTHGDSPYFKQLGFGPGLSENSRLLGVLAQHDAEIERLEKEHPSEAQRERRQAAIAKAKAEVAKWRTSIANNYGPRVKLANDQLQNAIAQRLGRSTSERRVDFLWRELQQLDPVKLQELYQTSNDEIRAAIVSMPPKMVKTDQNGTKLMPAIDPDFVTLQESKLHPQEARQVEVLTSLMNTFDFLANVADDELDGNPLGVARPAGGQEI